LTAARSLHSRVFSLSIGDIRVESSRYVIEKLSQRVGQNCEYPLLKNGLYDIKITTAQALTL